MYFTSVKLKNFRNYTEESVEFHPRVNLITGNNAQGKTNLLESLYIMSLGKSFRTSKDSEMIRFGEEFCRVETVSSKDGEELSVIIDYRKDGKSVQIDGVKINKNIEMLSHVYTVVFSPEDLKIVKEEPDKRRKFIDRELCQLKPVYYKNLARYKKILQQRNMFLKNGEINQAMLDVWNEELASYGSKIILERNRFISHLNEMSRELHHGITDGKEHLEISYESNVPVEGLKESFLQKLKSHQHLDVMRGNTSVGPHKDDLKICVDGVDIRHYGSQGQQRTAALSLKLAEIRMIQEEAEEDPILLLDDVLSELDGERQKFLVRSLSEIQIFITAAEIGPSLLESMPEGYVFHVEKGRVLREKNAS